MHLVLKKIHVSYLMLTSPAVNTWTCLCFPTMLTSCLLNFYCAESAFCLQLRMMCQRLNLSALCGLCGVTCALCYWICKIISGHASFACVKCASTHMCLHVCARMCVKLKLSCTIHSHIVHKQLYRHACSKRLGHQVIITIRHKNRLGRQRRLNLDMDRRLDFCIQQTTYVQKTTYAASQGKQDISRLNSYTYIHRHSRMISNFDLRMYIYRCIQMENCQQNKCKGPSKHRILNNGTAV